MSESDLPATQKAVIIIPSRTPATKGQSKTFVGRQFRDIEVKRIPLSPLLDGMYRIRTDAVALNPTDWKTCDIPMLIGYRTGMIAGCDFAGTIIEIGPNTRSRFRLGDRIAGMQHGSSALFPQYGAFASHIAIDEHRAWKLPADVQFDRAATTGVAISTSGLSLWWEEALNFPLPGESEEGKTRAEGEDFLIYGGATSVSQYLIQFAKIIGMRVIVVASDKNWELLKSLGADVTIDYHNPEKCIDEVRAVTGGKLKYAHDGISEGDSFRIVHSCMGDDQAKIVHVCVHQSFPRRASFLRPNIKDLFVLSYVTIGREVEFFGERTPRTESVVETSRKTMELTEKLFAERKLKLQDIELMPNGLAGIRDGYERARTVGLGPKKLVWKVEERPTEA